MRPHDIVSLTEIERYKTLFDVRGVVAALQMKFFYLNIRDKTTYKMTTTGETKTKTNKLMEKTTGVFIPMEVLQMDLTPIEKIVYAYYLQLCQCEQGAAFATNENVADVLGISAYTLHDKIKPNLRKKGFIISNGISTTVVKNTTQGVVKNTTENINEKRNIKDIKEKVKRKVEVMEETTTNKPTNTSSNEVGFNEWDIFNDFHSTDGVTEGVINNRGMNKATQKTNTNKPSSCKGVEETVTPKTKTVVESGDSPYTYNTSSCKVKTNVEWSRSDYGDLPFCDDVYTSSETYSLPSPTATKTAPQSARNTASGTTTHTEDKKPAEGAKTPSFDLQTPFDRLDKIVERKKKEKTPSQFSAWLMFDFVGQFLFQTKCKVSRDDKRVKPYVEMIKSNAGLNDKEKASIIERITN